MPELVNFNFQLLLLYVFFFCVNMKLLLTFAEHGGFGSAYLSFTTCFLLWLDGYSGVLTTTT